MQLEVSTLCLPFFDLFDDDAAQVVLECAAIEAETSVSKNILMLKGVLIEPQLISGSVEVRVESVQS